MYWGSVKWLFHIINLENTSFFSIIVINIVFNMTSVAIFILIISRSSHWLSLPRTLSRSSGTGKRLSRLIQEVAPQEHEVLLLHKGIGFCRRLGDCHRYLQHHRHHHYHHQHRHDHDDHHHHHRCMHHIHDDEHDNELKPVCLCPGPQASQ